MKYCNKSILVTLGAICSLFLLPSAVQAPEGNALLIIEYITDEQAYMFEKVGIDEGNGRMVKHRDDTGGVRTISWDKDED